MIRLAITQASVLITEELVVASHSPLDGLIIQVTVSDQSENRLTSIYKLISRYRKCAIQIAHKTHSAYLAHLAQISFLAKRAISKTIHPPPLGGV